MDTYSDLCKKHGVYGAELGSLVRLREYDEVYEAYKKGVPTQSRLVDFVTCEPTTWEDIKQPPKYSKFLRYRIKPEEDMTLYAPDKYDKWIKENLVDKPERAKQEAETWGENLHVPGAKDDASKPPVALVFESFPRALLEVAKVAGYGCKKYTRGGWKEVPDAITRYSDAGARHELYRHIEGETDPESGLLHLAHQAWNVLAVLEKTLEKN